jgi:hypothetical protein
MDKAGFKLRVKRRLYYTIRDSLSSGYEGFYLQGYNGRSGVISHKIEFFIFMRISPNTKLNNNLRNTFRNEGLSYMHPLLDRCPTNIHQPAGVTFL